MVSPVLSAIEKSIVYPKSDNKWGGAGAEGKTLRQPGQCKACSGGPQLFPYGQSKAADLPEQVRAMLDLRQREFVASGTGRLGLTDGVFSNTIP